jgi:glycosyltransferase involved in cell wall biosynthesis
MARTLPVLRNPPSAQALTRPVVFDTRVVTGSGGGPDKTILNSPRFLDPLGYTMLCGYLYPPEDPGYAVLEQKADKYQAPLVSIPDRGPFDTSVVSALLGICRKYKVAIWHGHDYKTNALGLMLNKFHRMKLVTTVHGWVHHTPRTPIYYKIDKWCLRRYEKVFCVSTDLYETCREIGVPDRKCELLDNGIDTVEYTRGQTSSAAKAVLGLPTTDLLVGGVGRLEAEKGFDVLIRSIHKLTTQGLAVRLVIVGEGSERTKLTALAAELGIADRVHLAGWQSDVRNYFEAMDLFALSSFREGLPNVLLEAMALEVPAVATRIAGIPKLIADQVNGRLVEPNDLDGLSSALSDVLRNPELRESYRQAARQTILTRFSFVARMERMKRVYDEMLKRASHESATR